MLSVFEDIHKGHFVRTAKTKDQPIKDDNFGVTSLNSSSDGSELSHGDVVDLRQLSIVQPIETTDDIIINDMPIITPMGDVVVSNLSLTVSGLFT